MNSLHSQQMWEMMRAHQEELRKAAQKEHLARSIRNAQVSWWRNLLRRSLQRPAIRLNPSVTPELS